MKKPLFLIVGVAHGLGARLRVRLEEGRLNFSERGLATYGSMTVGPSEQVQRRGS